MRGERVRGTGNVPAFATTLIGRQDDLAALRAGLLRARPLTITGDGGVGKTRLAVELARQVGQAYADGSWFVDLSELSEPTELSQAIARTIGVLDMSARAADDRVVDHLAGAEVLLILDNCEHLVPACARLIQRILQSSPDARIVATSRKVLGVASERIHAVAPLSPSDALQLLAERATAHAVGFSGDAKELKLGLNLCARLDHNPLAIELAATRLRTLSIEELIERLEDPFSVLRGDNRGAAPRQQTLRALIAWSHGICTAPARVLWARLSVFAGSFDAEAAERVCGGAGFTDSMVLETLHELVSSSIVVRETGPGRARFRLRETIRAYGREQLTASGDEARVRDRHLAFYLQRARDQAAGWAAGHQEEGLALLRRDRADVRAALEHSMTGRSDPAIALEFVGALRHHWVADAFLSEGGQWLDRALNLPGSEGHPQRPGTVWVAAAVALLQGDRADARTWLDEYERIATPTDVYRSYARGLRGTEALFAGELETAIAVFREALALSEQSDSKVSAIGLHFQLASALAQQGELDEAEMLCRAGLDLSERLGDRWGRSCVLWAFAYTTWLRGDFDTATGLCSEALEIQAGFNDGAAVAPMLELMAWISASVGDDRRARVALAAATGVWSELGTSIADRGPRHAKHHIDCVREVGRPPRGIRPRSIAEAIRLVLDPPGADRGELTAREWEVAELVAEGLTNRAIAARLVVSHRTVDSHVEHILAKLGFDARAQVAAWTVERRTLAQR